MMDFETFEDLRFQLLKNGQVEEFAQKAFKAFKAVEHTWGGEKPTIQKIEVLVGVHMNAVSRKVIKNPGKDHYYARSGGVKVVFETDMGKPKLRMAFDLLDEYAKDYS